MSKPKKLSISNLKKKSNQAHRRLQINDPEVLDLWVRAGGRCEFFGCNEYLLQDELTTNKVKLADIAHIVAFQRDGARGDDPLPLNQRNKIENLMLACLKHHRLIDNKQMVPQYPKEKLLEYKQRHEERIRFLTGLADERETTIIRLLGKIRGNAVSISNEEIRTAVFSSLQRYPRFLGAEDHIEIDLTPLSERDMAQYWQQGRDIVRDIIERRLVPAIEKNEIKHLSVFGLARIPFLVHLGACIGDKVPLEIFQKHHGNGDAWEWRTVNSITQFVCEKIQTGISPPAGIAVLASISGVVAQDQLPDEFKDYTVFCLKPSGITPGRSVIQSRDCLEQFKKTYSDFLRMIESTYPNIDEIHVFAAVPVSAALVMGRALLPDVSPALVVYDWSATGFQKTYTVYSKEQPR